MALIHGQDVERLSALTGYEREFVEVIAKRMIDNGIWIDGKVGFEKTPEENMAHWNIEFALHILVACGEVVKIPSN